MKMLGPLRYPKAGTEVAATSPMFITPNAISSIAYSRKRTYSHYIHYFNCAHAICCMSFMKYTIYIYVDISISMFWIHRPWQADSATVPEHPWFPNPDHTPTSNKRELRDKGQVGGATRISTPTRALCNKASVL